MALLSSTSPLSFSHNKPPALSHWSSDKIIPPLFHLPLRPTLPGGAQAWPRGDRKWAFATVISLSCPHSCSIPLSHTVTLAPTPPSKRTHSEQVTDHFKHLECGEAITLPSGHLQRPCHRSLLHSEWALLRYPHSSHSGSHHSASGVRPTTHISTAAGVRQPISWGIIFLLLVRSGTIGTSRCHSVSYLSQQRRQEDGGRDRGAYCLSVCSSPTGSLNERSHPSSVSTLCLFPPHHSPSPLCSSS